MAHVPMYSPAEIDRRVDISEAVARVVDRRRYILDAEVRQFEEAFAAYCGVTQCVGVANGTDAIEIVLRALGVGQGDRVAMVANAGPYASTATRSCGAEPLYVEIDAATRNMSAVALKAALRDSADRPPKVIVVTHLYGQLADMDAVLAAADGIPVVEDCAQAHGARRARGRAGSFGVAGTFSFYPTKNLPAVGDAGAVVTNDGDLAQRIRGLRQYGWSEKYLVSQPGGRNSRLDEIQAAVLFDRLHMLDEWNGARQAVARRYAEGLQGLPLDVPMVGPDYVAHLFAVELDRRDEMRAALAERGIETAVHFPMADHHQPAYQSDAASPPSLPNTERTCARVLSLPCFPGITNAQVDEVISTIKRCFRALGASVEDTIRT